MKRLLSIVLFCVLIPCANGETLYRDTPYKKFADGGYIWFTDGDETIHVKYVGEVKDGIPHGIGTETVSFDPHKGQKYVGKWKDGKPHGQGTLTIANGDKYVGEFKDAKRHVHGTSTFANGEKYVGEYKDDKYHGQGTYTWPTGEKYVGEYKDGKRWNGTQYYPLIHPYPAVRGTYSNGEWIPS